MKAVGLGGYAAEHNPLVITKVTLDMSHVVGGNGEGSVCSVQHPMIATTYESALAVKSARKKRMPHCSHGSFSI